MLAEQNSFFFGDISIDTRRFLQMLAELKSFVEILPLASKVFASIIASLEVVIFLVSLLTYMIT